jgi:hypothetical protein
VQSVAVDFDEIVLDLDVRGYALLRSETTQHSMTEAAARFGAHVGATCMGVRVLEAHGSSEWLPRHTEQLDDPEPLRYFALGCLDASASGGAASTTAGSLPSLCCSRDLS